VKLKTVAWWRRRKIVELQNKAWRAESFMVWLRDLIIKGKAAELALEEGEETNEARPSAPQAAQSQSIRNPRSPQHGRAPSAPAGEERPRDARADAGAQSAQSRRPPRSRARERTQRDAPKTVPEGRRDDRPCASAVGTTAGRAGPMPTIPQAAAQAETAPAAPAPAAPAVVPRCQASTLNSNTSSSSMAFRPRSKVRKSSPACKRARRRITDSNWPRIAPRGKKHGSPSAATPTGRCAAGACHAGTERGGTRQSHPVRHDQSRRQRPSRRFVRRGQTPSRSKGCRLHGAATSAHRGDATRFPRRTIAPPERALRHPEGRRPPAAILLQGERCTTGGRPRAHVELYGEIANGLRKRFNLPSPAGAPA
jgi:hypothetical protein